MPGADMPRAMLRGIFHGRCRSLTRPNRLAPDRAIR
jgi:hypothetical protein